MNSTSLFRGTLGKILTWILISPLASGLVADSPPAEFLQPEAGAAHSASSAVSARAPYQTVEEFLATSEPGNLPLRGGHPSYSTELRIPISLAEQVVEHASAHGCVAELTTDDVVLYSLYYRDGDTLHDIASIAGREDIIPLVAWGVAVGLGFVFNAALEYAESYLFDEPFSWSDVGIWTGIGALTGGLAVAGKAAMLARSGLKLAPAAGQAFRDSLRLGSAVTTNLALGGAGAYAAIIDNQLEAAGCLPASDWAPWDGAFWQAQYRLNTEGCIAPEVWEAYSQELVDFDYLAAASGEVPDPILPLSLVVSENERYVAAVNSSASVDLEWAAFPLVTGAALVELVVRNEGSDSVLRSQQLDVTAGTLNTVFEGSFLVGAQELLALRPGNDRQFYFFLRVSKGAFVETMGSPRRANGIPLYVDGPENSKPVLSVRGTAQGQASHFQIAYIDADGNAPASLTLQLVGPGGTQTVNLLPYLPSGSSATGLAFEYDRTLSNGAYVYRVLYSDGIVSRTNGDHPLRISSTPAQVTVNLSTASAQVNQLVSGTISVQDAAGPVPGIEVGLQTDRLSPFFDSGGQMVRKVATNSNGAASFSYRPLSSGQHTVLAMEPLSHSYAWTTLDVAANPAGWTTTWTWSLTSSTASEATYYVQTHILQPGGAPLDPGDYVYYSANHGSFQTDRDQVGASSIAENWYTLTLAEANSGPEVVTLDLPRYGATLTHATDLPVGSGSPLNQVRTTGLTASTSDSYSFGVSLSSDGRYIARVESSNIVVYSLTDLSIVRSVATGSGGLNCLDFSPDGNRIVAGDNDGYLYIVTVATGALVSASRTNSHADIINVDWYGSDRIAAATSGGSTTYPWVPKVLILNASLGLVNSIGFSNLINAEDIRRISCSASSGLCAAASEYGDDRWFLFSSSGGGAITEQTHPDGNMYRALAFNSAGDRLVVGGDNANGGAIVDLFSVSAGGATPLQDPFSTNPDTYAATFFSDGGTERLALGGRTKLETFSVDGGAILRSADDPGYLFDRSYHLEYLSGPQQLVAVTNNSQTYFNVSSDQNGPQISMNQPAPLPYTQNTAVITGTATDASGLLSTQYRIGNGNWLPLNVGGNGSFQVPVTGLLVGDTLVSVRATDARYNTSESTSVVTRLNDTDPPLVSDCLAYPAVVNLGMDLSVHCLVADLESGVSSVSMTIRQGTTIVSGPSPMSDGGQGIFTGVVVVGPWAPGIYSIDIQAHDAASPVNAVSQPSARFVEMNPFLLFADGLEAGNTSRWSISSP